MFITSPNLADIPHGFFTRRGGVSEGLYASLNCGLGSNDDKARVIENRGRVSAKLGAQENAFCTLYQTHSGDVITVEKSWRHSKLPRADAMVTNKTGLALGILTADCVPVLFADKKNRIIGAAHAGWKGALAGILQQTVAAMTALGADPAHISAAIGPAIAQNSYEVSEDFRKTFAEKNKDFAQYFIGAKRPDHWLFDLKAFVRDMLKVAGIHDINTLENDTYLEEDAFFSYRRTTHRGEPDYGRQISAILLKPET